MKKPNIIFVLLILSFLSCSLPSEEDDDCPEGYVPIDCNSSAPKQGFVQVSITTNSLNPAIPITIFYGDFENNKIFFRDTLTSNTEYELANDTYSVRAQYTAVIDGDTVTVFSVDGDDLDYTEDEYCDDTCYEKGSIELDAELDLSLFN
jgi:hypothetical protein